MKPISKYYFAGSQRVAVRTGGLLNFLLSDQLGSTNVTLDVNGVNVGELRYSAFGETRKTFGSTPTDYRYTGQREEAGIGLYYYNARWYDAYNTHFISPDTVIADNYNTLDYDRYAYARSNPLKYTDPSGHCADAISAPVCGALVPAGPVGWVIIGVLLVTDVVLIAVTVDAYISPPQIAATNSNLSDAVNTMQTGEAKENALLMNGEYIPPSLRGHLHDRERELYRDAVHGYKDEHKISADVNVPKSILDGLARDILNNKTPLEAIDNAPEPPDGLTKKGKPKEKPRRHSDEEGE